MEKAVDDFRKELATLRTGRANASILEGIRVDYHGTPMPVISWARWRCRTRRCW